jgi:hypothetical protein
MRVVAATLAMLALAPAAAAQIPLELRFDGQAFEPTAPPDFSCFGETANRWVACRVTKSDAAPGAYVLERPAPDRYRLHVSIDENIANPRRYPGDYEAQLSLEVTPTGPERVTVDLARLIHVTRPGDNARALEGMLTSCATQPRFDTSRLAWTPTARVEFAWEPVTVGAEYRASVSAVACAPPYRERAVLERRTSTTTLTLELPPARAGEYYMVRLGAWKGGRLVGELYTHDGGAHSWNYRFQVRDVSVPRWAYAAAGGVVLLLLVGWYRVSRWLTRRAARRRRARRVAVAALTLVAIGAVASVGYLYREEQARRRAEAERAAAEAAHQAVQRNFVAAFVSAAPRPAWWDEVTTPYRVDNVGDLLSAWQGHPRGDAGERQFFKAAWQGIVDHPDDEHVVATAIDLMYFVVRDYPHRLTLARFGYDHYFRHRRRVDNCVNCMVGDTSQSLTQNLSAALMEARRYDEAIEVCRRLIEARGPEVSPYLLAETWDRIAWAHWYRGDGDAARAIVRDALVTYGGTVRGHVLRETLARFEREPAPAAR